MSYSPEAYDDAYGQNLFVADAAVEERVAFIHRVYAHVGAATLLFVGLVAGLINTPQIAEPLAGFMMQSWWMVLLAFMGATWVAQSMANNSASPGVQYVGLGIYIVAEALIFTPLLYIMHAMMPGGDDVILQAGILTLLIFGGLTAVVLMTKTDFSFLRPALSIVMFAVLGLIVLSFFTSITLGTWFSVGMIVLMSGFILYETSNVLHHYHTNQHVAASLAIFASLATLFWYVLRLMSALRDD